MRRPATIAATITALLLLWSASYIFAQDRLSDVRSYEYRLTQVQEIRGSNLILCNAKQTQEGAPPLFFEFKPRAYGVAASDVASVWYGLERNNLQRSTLGGASVLAATALTDTTCILLFERADTLYLGEINTSLTLRSTLALPLTATTGSFTHTALLAGINSESQAVGVGTIKLLSLANGNAIALVIGNHLFWGDWGRGSYGGSDKAFSPIIRYMEGYAPSDIVALNPDTRDNNDPACVLLRESGLRKDVIMLSPSGKELWSQSLDVQQRTILRRVSNYTVAACTERGATAYINIIKIGATPVTTGIAAKMECIAFAEEQGRVSAFAVVNDNISGRYIWTAVRVPLSGGTTFSQNLWTFPDNIIAPLAVTVFGDEFFCVFANTLAVMNFGGEPLGLMRLSNAFRLVQMPLQQQAISITGNQERNLYALRLGRDNIIVKRDPVPLWWLRNIVGDFWLYVVLLSILGILLAMLNILRYQSRLLTTLFGVSGADAMFIVDAEGKLVSLNDSARALLNIAIEVPMRRLFQFYCVTEGAQNLSHFVRETLKTRQAMDKTISLQKTPLSANPNAPDSTLDPDETHDYLFSAIPVQTRFGSARGMMLIGKDITEELGKKKLGNWAQLGHDLQTNLAAIRLNAEKIAESGSSEGKSIVYQARLVQQRIKDIITVGKSEQLEMHPASTADICLKVSREFDKILYPNVAFRIESPHILFQCAEPQLVRALRNAVENGITRGLVNNSGIIAISAWLEDGSVWFQVRDNGRGMSPAVMRRMMNKGFTTFESKGGSGLGTMIMQYIVKAHKGEILVQSEEEKGTTVQFRLPAINVRTLPQKPLLILPGETLDV